LVSFRGIRRTRPFSAVINGKPGPVVFNSQAARDAFEGASRSGEEFIVGHLGAGVAFVFHSRSRILLNPMTVQVSDSAMRVGGLV
jgi:hypothetical protein